MKKNYRKMMKIASKEMRERSIRKCFQTRKSARDSRLLMLRDFSRSRNDLESTESNLVNHEDIFREKELENAARHRYRKECARRSLIARLLPQE